VAVLRVEEGPRRGAEFDLPEGRSAVAGRDPRCPIHFEDGLASRHHFQIKEHRGAHYIRDLGSQNGTFVNGERLTSPRRLDPGDEIRGGDTCFVYLRETAEAEAEAERGPEPEPEAANGTEAPAGRVIGGYEIKKRIGRGGMGVVYLANQISLGRDVALKVLSARLTKDQTFVQLFIEEARAAGRLNHPNIVQVYDVASEGDRYFISMELMEQGSVEDELRREGKLSVERGVAIMLDAARGLQYAEGKKIVHRDIKPDNLMINADGVAKIADLGLAQSTHDRATGTGEEGILGTPHFIAPEQALGREVDARADIYSLGATFYRVVTGETPFKGSSAREIVLQQIHEDPQPVREVNPEVPDDVAAVIEKMMRKDPDERHASAAELIEDLERVQKAHHYGRRSSRTAWILAAAVTLVLIVVGVRFALRGPAEDGTPSDVGPNGGTATAPDVDDSAREAELLESRANAAFLAVQIQEQNLGRTRALAAEYRKVADEFAGTRKGREAADRADRIEEEVARREAAEAARKREERERAARIDATWTAVDEALAKSAETNEYAAGLATALAQPGLAEMVESQERRDRWTAALDRHAKGAAEHVESVLEKAGGLVAAASFDEAADLVRAAIGRLTPLPEPSEAAAAADVLSRYAAARERLAAGLEEIGRKKRESVLNRDRDRFFRPVAEAYESIGATRFEEAAASLRELGGELATEEYRGRLEEIASAVERMAALKRKLITTIREGRLAEFEVPLDTPVEDVEAGHPVAADDDSVILEIPLRSAGRLEKRVLWTELSPSILLRMVEQEGAGFTDEDRDAAALSLVARGELDRAEAAIRRWPATESRDRLLERIEREREARTLREQGTRHYREKRWGAALEALRRLRDEFADTREALVHSDGSSHYFRRP
jgi:hypothetical protein